MGEYMLFIYERNQDFRQTLYAVVPSRPPPPQFKKNPTNVCAYTYMYTYPYTHTAYPHGTRIHTCPQHCAPAVTLSNSFTSPPCSPLPS